MPTTLSLTTATAAPLLLTVPTRWADVSLAQYVALYAPEPGDARLPAEVLCGLPAATLGQVAVVDVNYLANLLAFASDPSDILELAATPGLPDIGTLPYGILLEAHRHIEAHPDRPWLAHAPYLLALYRVQLTYGRYDEAKVAACLAALLAAPVAESYADAAFFLSSYKSWQTGTPPPKTTTTPRKTKSWRPGARSWASALARCSAWMRRRGAAC